MKLSTDCFKLTDGKDIVGKYPVLLGATLLIWYEPWMANITFEKRALKHDNLGAKRFQIMSRSII